MIINIADLKKKITYRSKYRGTKEMDKLLSSFTQKYIDTFNDVELNYLIDCRVLILDFAIVPYLFNSSKNSLLLKPIR